MLYGHRIADQTRNVEQYGHVAPLRFIQLDGMIAGGYATWVTHGQRGTGGWIGKEAIYQIRPMYADGPLKTWRHLTDPELRERDAEEIRLETERDAERAKREEVVSLPGLRLRLQRQYAEKLRDRLAAEGLSGDALRDAFLRTASLERLASSIWAHEGRHAIDKTLGIRNDVDLEFRAKLSEVVFAPAPRTALGSILSPIGRPSTHGIANQRVLKGVVSWMHAHSAEIAEVDLAAPLLTQLDRLTDDQLRAAFRSLDPIAN